MHMTKAELFFRKRKHTRILTLTLTTSSGQPAIADESHDSKHFAKFRIAWVKEPDKMIIEHT